MSNDRKYIEQLEERIDKFERHFSVYRESSTRDLDYRIKQVFQRIATLEFQMDKVYPKSKIEKRFRAGPGPVIIVPAGQTIVFKTCPNTITGSGE